MALTNKQNAFIEHYLQSFNATKAALEAGYPPRSARSIGAENLTKPDIGAVIKQKLSETAMLADEVLMRLAEQARSSIAPFFVIGEGTATLDLSSPAAKENLHLIKKATQRRRITRREKRQEETEEIVTIIELHDSQSALSLLARHHGLLLDKTEHSGAVGALYQPPVGFLEALERVYGTKGERGDQKDQKG